MNRWDNHWYELCNLLATMSRCKSRQIGAVIVRDKCIVSTGYNGPPRGATHCGEVCPRREAGYKSGEGLHLCPSAHAEANAIVNAARLGVSTVGATMYMNCLIPCKTCMGHIINSGINEVVCTTTRAYDSFHIPLIDDFLRLVIVRKYTDLPPDSSHIERL